ncbi:SufE family protein [Candidatus Raskinella chloraquaticus]|uniref:Cysteine desufuration protein SufE n=1 Tax=Candidatus Raskinella chloraquaticus TaxID=1951219 RepID=A0A1W9HQH2_9HYPH|nr:MAG: cysteine desufuration protein SufE [Proteobacteria bacterium SG_bin8]
MNTSFADIKETLALIDDWEERYRFIIDLGRELPPLPEDRRTDAYKVRGCASQVWLVPEWRSSSEGPRFSYQGDSDAHIVRGLVAIVLALYDGRTREAVLHVDAKAEFDDLGLSQHLTAQRANGLFSMVERIKADAQAALAV